MLYEEDPWKLDKKSQRWLTSFVGIDWPTTETCPLPDQEEQRYALANFPLIKKSNNFLISFFFIASYWTHPWFLLSLEHCTWALLWYVNIPNTMWGSGECWPRKTQTKCGQKKFHGITAHMNSNNWNDEWCFPMNIYGAITCGHLHRSLSRTTGDMSKTTKTRVS